MPRRFLVASFLAFFAASIAAVLGAAVPAVSAATGVPASTVGQLTTVLSAGSFAPLLLWRRAQRGRPTRHLVVGAVSLLAASALAVALNPASTRAAAAPGSFGILAATILVVGVAFGGSQVAISSIVANRGASPRTLNALHGMYGLGAVTLPLVVARYDLRTVALLVAAVALLAVPHLRAAPDLRDDPGGPDEVTASGRLRRDLRWVGFERLWHGDGSRPWVWMFSVAIGVEIGTLAWAPTHLVSQGASEQAAAATISGYFAVFTLARFGLATVIGRFDLRRVVVGATVLGTMAATAAALVPTPTIAWILVGLGVGPVFPTTLSWVAQLRADPDVTRKLMIGGSVGAVLLPALVGVLAGLVGPSAIPWAIAAFGAAASVLAATLPPTDGRRPAATGAATSGHP